MVEAHRKQQEEEENQRKRYEISNKHNILFVFVNCIREFVNVLQLNIRHINPFTTSTDVLKTFTT